MNKNDRLFVGLIALGVVAVLGLSWASFSVDRETPTVQQTAEGLSQESATEEPTAAPTTTEAEEVTPVVEAGAVE